MQENTRNTFALPRTGSPSRLKVTFANPTPLSPFLNHSSHALPSDGTPFTPDVISTPAAPPSGCSVSLWCRRHVRRMVTRPVGGEVARIKCQIGGKSSTNCPVDVSLDRDIIRNVEITWVNVWHWDRRCDLFQVAFRHISSRCLFYSFFSEIPEIVR